MSLPKVLIVEGNDVGSGSAGRALRQENLTIKTITNSEEALQRNLGQEAPGFDLVLLDIGTTGMYGLTICRELRSKSNVPIVMLSDRDDETSIVVGLEIGADDYITKPFRPTELVSRVRARLRRSRWRVSDSERNQLKFPGLEIDLPRHQVRVLGNPVELTAAQFSILVLLASHPGRVYNRAQIMEPIWGGEFYGASRAADAHIQNIRRCIEPDPQTPLYIQTVRGRGYRFTEI